MQYMKFFIKIQVTLNSTVLGVFKPKWKGSSIFIKFEKKPPLKHKDTGFGLYVVFIIFLSLHRLHLFKPKIYKLTAPSQLSQAPRSTLESNFLNTKGRKT